MTTWTRVCAVDDLVPDRGAAALVDGHQVAIFRLSDSGAIHAVDHLDPFSHANVMARGLVGSRLGTPTVASPMHKQSFDLVTGQCLDDPAVSLQVWPTRVADGWVEVGSAAA
ncbi:nitrite reductase small subunit NirD [Aeromicrobium stalagmiti]|uniref:nitrite reductase small subunit NirD n=1 Tax=Aeromicrobium stalagmiti TaxID=2738988 RepID=UPI0015686D5C|nr:nitrite reductase small subunit NirD [Aeromicrobium stalagmiti]NRQ50331.1 nitrite reductase small subunit NirD [Aeromicrobium stalagmiti]